MSDRRLGMAFSPGNPAFATRHSGAVHAALLLSLGHPLYLVMSPTTPPDKPAFHSGAAITNAPGPARWHATSSCSTVDGTTNCPLPLPPDPGIPSEDEICPPPRAAPRPNRRTDRTPGRLAFKKPKIANPVGKPTRTSEIAILQPAGGVDRLRS